jgi:hypothetical protein
MPRILFLLLGFMTLHAGGPGQLMEQLDRLKGSEPVQLRIETSFKRTLSYGGKTTAEYIGSAKVLMKEGSDGRSLTWERKDLDKIGTELASRETCDQPSPTALALSALDPLRTDELANAAGTLATLVRNSTFEKEEITTWEGAPALLLTFKITCCIPESLRMKARTEKKSLKILTSPLGIPLASNLQWAYCGRKGRRDGDYGHSLSQEARYAIHGNRLVPTRLIQAESELKEWDRVSTRLELVLTPSAP